MTRDQAAREACSRLSAQSADVVMRYAKGCFRLYAETSSKPAPIGTSRLGGKPDLTPGTPWPTWDAGPILRAQLAEDELRAGGGGRIAEIMAGVIRKTRSLLEHPRRPLDFLCQLNLADFARTGSPLPKAGLLSFFFDRRQLSWGFDPNDRGSAQVIYTPADHFGDLQPGPTDTPGEFPTHLCNIRLAAGVSIPSRLPRVAQAAGATEDLYDQLRLTIVGPPATPHHQLLGHPANIQNDMRLECQLASNGINCGTPQGSQGPRRAELQAGVVDRILLAQFDTDEHGPDWNWGDCGRLYFWIRRPDMQKGDFSRVWCVLQSG